MRSVPKIIAFGGVATGSMNAQEAEIDAGINLPGVIDLELNEMLFYIMVFL